MPFVVDLAHRILQVLADVRREGKEMTYLRPDSKSRLRLNIMTTDNLLGLIPLLFQLSMTTLYSLLMLLLKLSWKLMKRCLLWYVKMWLRCWCLVLLFLSTTKRYWPYSMRILRIMWTLPVSLLLVALTVIRDWQVENHRWYVWW